jgi:hypothetical protein
VDLERDWVGVLVTCHKLEISPSGYSSVIRNIRDKSSEGDWCLGAYAHIACRRTSEVFLKEIPRVIA